VIDEHTQPPESGKAKCQHEGHADYPTARVAFAPALEHEHDSENEDKNCRNTQGLDHDPATFLQYEYGMKELQMIGRPSFEAVR